MRIFSFTKPAVVAALLIPYAISVAQGLGIADVLAGKGRASTLAPQDLPDGFHAARIVSAGTIPDPMASMLPFVMASPSNGPSGPNLDYLTLIDESWTDGTIDVVEGQRFLVTYRLDITLADFIRRSGQFGQAGVPMPQPKMKLRLVRVDGIQSISPDPELTKDRMLEILGQGKGKTVFDQASEAAARTATLSNVKQIALGTIMYTSDWDDVYPYAQGTKAVQYVTYPYVKNADVWTTKNPNGGEFRFNLSLAGASSTAVPYPDRTVLFYESNEWPDGKRVVAYADGHAKVVSREEWEHLVGGLRIKIAKTAKRPLPLNYGKNWKPGDPHMGGG